ncbi:NAD(P)/FAD-dependent oxidoreductase [Candidatus Nitrospira bockiana]
MISDRADIVVIGGGAAGLAAAIFAAEAAGGGSSVVVLDGAARLGAKILVSGGGRCNVTNATVGPDDFHGARPVVRNILAAFDETAAQRWFASLGVPLKEEESGKLFPVTNKARTVLDALLARCRALGVSVTPSRRVINVGRLADDESGRPETAFRVDDAHGGVLHARRVIMATGGRSLPRSGSDGSGWTIVGRLGHTVTATAPALVPLVLEPGTFSPDLSGISHPAELTTFADGKVADRRIGSMLWTHFGVSGPAVLDASRVWTTAEAAGARPDLFLNFLPGHEFQDVERWWLTQAAARPRARVVAVLAQRLPERVAAWVCRSCGLDPALSLGRLSSSARRSLTHAVTRSRLAVVRDRGWNFAEVTAGGVPLAEIDYRTMASRKVWGLFLVGEMLDCDGRIGGFNFQWAWATGYLGGRGAAASLRRDG